MKAVEKCKVCRGGKENKENFFHVDRFCFDLGKLPLQWGATEYFVWIDFVKASIKSAFCGLAKGLTYKLMYIIILRITKISEMRDDNGLQKSRKS